MRAYRATPYARALRRLRYQYIEKPARRERNRNLSEYTIPEAELRAIEHLRGGEAPEPAPEPIPAPVAAASEPPAVAVAEESDKPVIKVAKYTPVDDISSVNFTLKDDDKRILTVYYDIVAEDSAQQYEVETMIRGMHIAALEGIQNIQSAKTTTSHLKAVAELFKTTNLRKILTNAVVNSEKIKRDPRGVSTRRGMLRVLLLAAFTLNIKIPDKALQTWRKAKIVANEAVDQRTAERGEALATIVQNTGGSDGLLNHIYETYEAGSMERAVFGTMLETGLRARDFTNVKLIQGAMPKEGEEAKYAVVPRGNAPVKLHIDLTHIRKKGHQVVNERLSKRTSQAIREYLAKRGADKSPLLFPIKALSNWVDKRLKGTPYKIKGTSANIARHLHASHQDRQTPEAVVETAQRMQHSTGVHRTVYTHRAKK